MLIIHNMGYSCSPCTLWTDVFYGLVDHLDVAFSFVVSSHNSPDTMKKKSASMSRKFLIVSSKENTFFQDMGFAETKKERIYYQLGYSMFQKNPDETISRIGMDSFAHGDRYCLIWHILKFLPLQINWSPKKNY